MVLVRSTLSQQAALTSGGGGNSSSSSALSPKKVKGGGGPKSGDGVIFNRNVIDYRSRGSHDRRHTLEQFSKKALYDNSNDKVSMQTVSQNRPELQGRILSYDHLATSSLAGVETGPNLRFVKGNLYLTRWWTSAKKWRLLTGEFAALDEGSEGGDRVAVNGTAAVVGAGNNVVSACDGEEELEEELFDDEDVEELEEEVISRLGSLDEKELHGEEDIFPTLELEVEQDDEEGGDADNDGSANFGFTDFDLEDSPMRQESADSQRQGWVPLTQLYTLCNKYRSRVICIGDVHGCVDELLDLLRKVQYRPGDIVLLLGDLVAKGPSSAAVVRLAMDIGALSVRGNHDHEVVRQGMLHKRNSHADSLAGVPFPKLSSRGSEHRRIALELSDEEFRWLAALPYYIQSFDLGTLFVHAGFQNGIKVADQDPWVMMSMRSVLPDGRITTRCFHKFSWANKWRGPQTVLFGHDAARGLQQYDHAVGLDTGCVYGGCLTALLLPDKEYVSVPARKAYLGYGKSKSHKMYNYSKESTGKDRED